MNQPQRGLGTTAGLALAALGIITLLALASMIFLPHDPAARFSDPLSAASLDALLGTDEAGRDLLSRLLTGMTMAWFPSLAVVAVSAAAGTLLGLIAGASRGWLGRIAHIPINLLRVLPAPVMALAAVAVLGPGIHTLGTALALFGWPWYARVVRADILAARAAPYAEAARLTAPGRWLYFLPVALPGVVPVIAYDLGNTVLILSLLSFLGLGDPSPAAELGAMTEHGLAFVMEYPRVAVMPAVLVFGMVLAANLTGTAFRRRLARR